jgi:hypothetical protein
MGQIHPVQSASGKPQVENVTEAVILEETKAIRMMMKKMKVQRTNTTTSASTGLLAIQIPHKIVDLLAPISKKTQKDFERRVVIIMAGLASAASSMSNIFNAKMK